MKQLLEAGVHFGHQTRRWNPKMAKYIFTERNGIYIIDLQKTVRKVDEAFNFIRSVAQEGKKVLFVGTKKQAQEAVKEEAVRAGMFYVNERWLGGMLTNFQTIQKRIKRLKQLPLVIESQDFDYIAFNSKIELFGKDNILPDKTVKNAQLIFEELVKQQLTKRGNVFPINVIIEYSEADGNVSFEVSYNGDRFDPVNDGDEISSAIVRNASSSIDYTYDEGINRFKSIIKSKK